MAVISFINPKGGSGKTTLSFVLAEQFAQMGNSVCLIDADPNGFVAGWIEGRDAEFGEPPFDVKHVVDTQQIVSAIEEAAESFDVVLVDTEGTANLSITRVLSRTHLAIIPLNASIMDASQANRAVRLLLEEGQMLSRDIEYRLVFSRTSAAIMNATHSALVEDLRKANYPVMKAHLNERRAFRDIFEYNRVIWEMIAGLNELSDEHRSEGRNTEARKVDDVRTGYEKAQVNARTVAEEVTQVLHEIANKEAA